MRPFPAALLLCACGPLTVSGSLSALIDLEYTQVPISSTPLNTDNPSQTTVAFVWDHSGLTDISLEITANYDGTQFEPGVALDLAQLDSNGDQRGSVSRNVFDDPIHTFPALTRGQLTLNGPPISGKQVSGSFYITFVDGTDFADGTTAYADFLGVVQ